MTARARRRVESDIRTTELPAAIPESDGELVTARQASRGDIRAIIFP